MPKKEFFTMVSEQDGLKLSMMMVRSDGEPRALVQLAHGMCEHKERYAPFMEYLAEKGCLCVINDHRGHGGSVRKGEDLGYFYENGDVALVEDLHQITLWMRKKWPEIPLFLFGHSMGSLAVRAYCERYDNDIDALAVCGSPGNNPAAGVGLVLIRLLTLFRGERYRSRLIHSMTIGAFAKRFPNPQHPCSWISANAENVDAYEKDPLCSFAFTLNGDRALLRLMRRCYSLQSDGRNTALPIRFYSGADDPCAPDESGFQDAMERMKRAGYLNVQGHMFSGLRHEILNETNRIEVFERIWEEAFEPNLCCR